MHPLDADIVRHGRPLRPSQPAPGLPGLLFPLVRRFFHEGGLPPVAVEHELQDGAVLEGGITVIHVPGASAGQVALLWNRTLIAGDAISNVWGFDGHQFGYEDRDEARRSMEKLLSRDFDNAVFGHGKPMVDDASARLQKNLRIPLRLAA
jgi:glyoxylase-like metal-dependent hydrolase (beta-lactamase superfamily II)